MKTITRERLTELYNEFYNKNEIDHDVLSGSLGITNKKSKECVLALDEFNRAAPQVLNASLELVLNREINGHKLPTSNKAPTFVCAMVNPADEDYNVSDLDPAMLDRWLSYTLKPDAESWLQWAQKNEVHDIVRRFIAKKPQYIHTTSETEKVTPTPRSWTKLSDLLYAVEKTKCDNSYLYTVIKGKIGKSIGAEFLNFYNEYSNMVSIEDIRETAENGYTVSMDKAIKDVKKLIKKQEPAILLDFANQLFDETGQVEDISEESNVPFIAFFHAAPLELIASILKSKRAEDFAAYRVVAKVNKEIFAKICDIKHQ